MKIGSEFLPPIPDKNREILGMEKEYFGLCVCVGLSVSLAAFLFYLEVPDLLVYLVLGLTMTPGILLVYSKVTNIKDRLLFFYTVQQRSWITEFNQKEIDKHGFIRDKQISEADENREG